MFVVLVLSTCVASYFQNDLDAVSATTPNVGTQLMPFDLTNMFETGQAQNETIDNSSSINSDDNQDKPIECEMPPCPPGQACIQSCP